MALTPIDFEIEDDVTTAEESETTAVSPSKTWQLDFVNGRLGGVVDGKEAIQQFIYKALMTARERYLIYSDSYGSEVFSLTSHDVSPSVLINEAPRLITEAIIYDERIESVDNFEFEQQGDKLYVTFTVTLYTGELLDSEVIL